MTSCPAGGDPAPVPAGNIPGRWLTLVPVEVFGLECDDHDTPHPVAWGLCDAVAAWSDCNRADGHIYRVDDLPGVARQPGQTVRVWVAEADAEFFRRYWGEGYESGADCGMVPPAAVRAAAVADHENVVDGLIGWWFENNPGVRRAYAQDPAYHTRAQLMFRVLTIFEAAIRDVGLDRKTRLRVLRTVLAEVMDTDAALERVAATRRQARAIAADLAASPDMPLLAAGANAANHWSALLPGRVDE